VTPSDIEGKLEDVSARILEAELRELSRQERAAGSQAGDSAANIQCSGEWLTVGLIDHRDEIISAIVNEICGISPSHRDSCRPSGYRQGPRASTRWLVIGG